MTRQLGANNKKTGEYIYPKIANKMDEYSCIECQKDLIYCQGNKRAPYFRHKVDAINPCHHYSSPTEDQIHTDAEKLLKTILEKNINITFIRKCCQCKKNEEFEIPSIMETSSIQLEYRFEYNGLKIADVAYIDDGELLCIFEICNTHKTISKNRPEPWFEIDALSLIKHVNDLNSSQIQIDCIRCEKCDECVEQEKYNIEQKQRALDILYGWFQSGIEIPPFIYDWDNFWGVEKDQIKCEFTPEIFDLVLYVSTDICQRYCIRLVNNSSQVNFTREIDYAEFNIGVYYLDIDWILSQQTIPKKINCIASLDCFSYNKANNSEKKCKSCGLYYNYWVKRINVSPDCRYIPIGCTNCNKGIRTSCGK